MHIRRPTAVLVGCVGLTREIADARIVSVASTVVGERVAAEVS